MWGVAVEGFFLGCFFWWFLLFSSRVHLPCPTHAQIFIIARGATPLISQAPFLEQTVRAMVPVVNTDLCPINTEVGLKIAMTLQAVQQHLPAVFNTVVSSIPQVGCGGVLGVFLGGVSTFFSNWRILKKTHAHTRSQSQ